MKLTIGQVIAQGQGCWAVCHCGHGTKARLDAIADAFGPDLTLADLAAALVCDACGQKGAVSFALTGYECGFSYPDHSDFLPK